MRLRILFALPYSPGPTRVRSRMILERLCARHDVTLLALAWDAQDVCTLNRWRAKAHEVHIVDHGRRQQLRGLLGNPLRPFQAMVSTSPEFARTLRSLILDAKRAGRPFDSVHIEHFRGANAANLAEGLDAHVVYDAVDCLSVLAEQARTGAIDRKVRLVAGTERWRTRRAEDLLIDRADFIAVVAERDRTAMVRERSLEHVVVIPNGVERAVSRPGRLTEIPRVVFTGKLSYHANQAALRWLVEDIWPRVRQSVAAAELTVAGADPPEWLRRAAGSTGISVVANPPDMNIVLRSARVGVAPMTYSVGIQNKVLEAMGAALPVVATRSAVAGFGPESVPGIAVADDAADFATQISRLLLDDRYAEALRRGGFDYVMKHHNWDEVALAFEQLYVPASAAVRVA